MASTLELYVDGSNWYARTATFVASCVNVLGNKVKLSVKEPGLNDTTTGVVAMQASGSCISLTLGDGTTLTQTNTILEELVRVSGQTQSLLGTDPVERAQIIQWITYAAKNHRNMGIAAMELNVIFQKSTFLVGDRITLADLVLFWCAHPFLESIPAGKWASGSGPKSLARWYKSVEHSTLVKRAKVSPPTLTLGRTDGAFSAPPSGTFNGAFAAAAAADAAPTADKVEGSKNTAVAEPAKNTKASKKEKKKKEPKPAAAPVPAVPGDANPFTKICIRVGKITKVWHHPDSEKLFCEEIDIGEDKPRSVASGLRPYYKLEDLQDRMIIMVCNLKEAKLGGFPSCGMVLCSKNGDTCEFVDPPKSGKVGDRLMLDGVTGDFETNPNKVKKKKMWEAVAAQLKTNGDRVACFDGKPLKTPSGDVCTCPTVSNTPIS
jgi:methionine--tRNA ligase beta chain